MSYWADTAKRVIQEVHLGLPDSATLAERQAAVDAAYPFGERAYSPYKAWLRARREYLCRYGYQPKGLQRLVESPLERMIRRSKLGQVNGVLSPSAGSLPDREGESR